MLWISLAWGQDVCPSTCPFSDVQAAVDAATSGDTVTIGSGTYTGGASIAKTLVLEGAGSAQTVLRSSSSTILLVTAGTVTLRDFGVDGQSTRSGIEVGGTADVSLDGVLVHDTTATTGGGLRIIGSATADVDSSSFISNTATSGDGGHIEIDVAGETIIVLDSSFDMGVAGDDGGAIHVRDSTLIVDESAFSNNQCTNTGGAIYLRSTGDLAEVRDTTFTSNFGDRGGAFYTLGPDTDSTVLFIRNDFLGNFATGFGGGAIGFAPNNTPRDISIRDNTFTGGSGGFGGAIYIDDADDVRIWDNTISGASGDEGGAIHVVNADLSMQRNVLCNNSATSLGGGLYLEDTDGLLEGVVNNIVQENTATGSGGGAYVLASTVPIRFNTFVDNTAVDGAGLLQEDHTGPVQNNLFVAHTIAIQVESGAANSDWNGFFGNGTELSGDNLGGNDVVMLTSPVPGYVQGVCAPNNLLPEWTGPVRDAANTGLVDLDGTRADLGHVGGLSADPDLWVDVDNDGVPWLYDCDDDDIANAPDQVEICDGQDNDCDGVADNGITPPTWYLDDDEDSYGDPAVAVMACTAPADHVADGSDCDDADTEIFPGAEERCNGEDDDCNGAVPADEVDADNDLVLLCNNDCDDDNPLVAPGAVELCDGLDNDCNSVVDDNVMVFTWYRDADDDTYGDANDTQDSCSQPVGYVLDDSDCDDTLMAVNPAGTETCNGIDDDCNTGIDDDAVDATVWYIDGDSDLTGDMNDAGVLSCNPLSGRVNNAADCDDTDDTVFAGAQELCDSQDNDCDGDVDEGVVDLDWYADADFDGLGDPNDVVVSCEDQPGRVTNDWDCDDTDPNIGETCPVETGDTGDTDVDDTDTDVEEDFVEEREAVVDTTETKTAGGPSGCSCDNPRAVVSPWWLLELVRRQ